MDSTPNNHWTEDQELLEQYVLGRLDAERHIELDLHLAGCATCRSAVQSEREMSAGVKLAGREAMKANLRKRLAGDGVRVFQRYQYVSLAAAVLVIAAGIGIFRYYGVTLEWPSKFSSHQYVVNSANADSTAAEKKEEPALVEADKLADKVNAAPAGEAEKKPGQVNAPPAGNAALSGASGAGGAERTQSPLADIESSHSSLSTIKQERAFWLLGTIIPVSEQSETAQPRAMQSESRKDRLSKSKRANVQQMIKVQRGDASQTITLQQRPLTSLPGSRAQMVQHDRSLVVQTFVERTPKGLQLTLYTSGPTAATDMERATVEPISDDSLVVSLANERIAYHIPGGWGTQRSTKTDEDHQ